MKCNICGVAMKQLLTSWYCPNEINHEKKMDLYLYHRGPIIGPTIELEIYDKAQYENKLYETDHKPPVNTIRLTAAMLTRSTMTIEEIYATLLENYLLAHCDNGTTKINIYVFFYETDLENECSFEFTKC